MRRLPWVLLLAGCGGSDTECASGFAEGGDGNCYQTTTDTATPTGDPGPTGTVPAGIQEWLEALEDCDLAPGDGTLDLAAGCAGSVCVSMDYDAINTAVGETGACEVVLYESGGFSFRYADCTWSNGLGANFDDEDEDGVPDAGAEAGGITVEAPFAGSTSDGIGIGTPSACLVPVLGLPDSVTFSRGLGRYDISSLSWYAQGLYAYDFGGPGPYDFEPDGLIEQLTIYGAR